MRSFIFLSLILSVVSVQSAYIHNPAGDRGEPYVHDTTGDHGPYYYWKLRQQAKEEERSSAEPVSSTRKVISVRKLVKKQPLPPPEPQQSRFANFRVTGPAAPAAPARQPEIFQSRVRQAQPVARQHVRQQQPQIPQPE